MRGTRAPVVPYHRLSQRPDSDRDRYQVRRPAELGVDLVEQRLVTLHDPGGDLLVADPGGVLDEGAAGLIVGEVRGTANRVVVVAVDPHDLRPLIRDASGDLREHHHRDEHGRPDTEMGRHPGDRAAVVAVGGGDQHGTGVPLQHLAGSPGGAEHLERRQAQPRRLILHQQPTDPQFGGEFGDRDQRSGRVARQRPVKGVSVTRRGPADPVPGGRQAVPRCHAAHCPGLIFIRSSTEIRTVL